MSPSFVGSLPRSGTGIRVQTMRCQRALYNYKELRAALPVTWCNVIRSAVCLATTYCDAVKILFYCSVLLISDILHACYIYAYAWQHLCLYAFVCVYNCTHVRMCACAFVCMFAYKRVCVYAYYVCLFAMICMYMYMYKCTYLRLHINFCIYIYRYYETICINVFLHVCVYKSIYVYSFIHSFRPFL